MPDELTLPIRARSSFALESTRRLAHAAAVKGPLAAITLACRKHCWQLGPEKASFDVEECDAIWLKPLLRLSRYLREYLRLIYWYRRGTGSHRMKSTSCCSVALLRRSTLPRKRVRWYVKRSMIGTPMSTSAWCEYESSPVDTPHVP